MFIRSGKEAASRRRGCVSATAADPMEVVAASEGAVAIEVHPDLVAGAALRAAALIREGRERSDVDGRLRGLARALLDLPLCRQGLPRPREGGWPPGRGPPA